MAKQDETHRVCKSCLDRKPLADYGAYLVESGKTHHGKVCTECIVNPVVRIEHSVYRADGHGSMTVSWSDDRPQQRRPW